MDKARLRGLFILGFYSAMSTRFRITQFNRKLVIGIGSQGPEHRV